METVYLKSLKEGRLSKIRRDLYDMLESCELCARRCKVNRIKGQKGFCGATAEVYVSGAFPHFGEEPPLVGVGGSGTIFLTFCNLKCVFCQNYEISHFGKGHKVSVLELSRMMLELQEIGCHNINFVTPTHYLPQIVAAIEYAAQNGLSIPAVYNTSTYENPDVLKLIYGVFDIYMPDMKFSSKKSAKRYLNAEDYPEISFKNLLEMHAQVGDLVIDERGIAKSGLLVRHLVMPNDVCGTEEILRFISEKVSKNTYVNIMAQYFPYHLAYKFPEIGRTITNEEYLSAISTAKRLGLKRIGR